MAGCRRTQVKHFNLQCIRSTRTIRQDETRNPSSQESCGQYWKLIIKGYKEQTDASHICFSSFELDVPHALHHQPITERRQRCTLPIQRLNKQHADVMTQSWVKQWEVAVTFLVVTEKSEVWQQAQQMSTEVNTSISDPQYAWSCIEDFSSSGK